MVYFIEGFLGDRSLMIIRLSPNYGVEQSDKVFLLGRLVCLHGFSDFS